MSQSSHRPKWIPVVIGIIKSKNKVLLGVRPEGNSFPGLWEFPGGKIELGESPEEALVRELNEELGISITDPKLHFAVTHSYSETGLLLMFFEVIYWKGEPKNLHHSELKWYEASDLSSLDLPEANKKALKKIQAIIKA